MKKFLALVLCLTLVLTCFTALLGCGGNESGDTQGGNSVGALDNSSTDSGSTDSATEQVKEFRLVAIENAFEAGLLTADDVQHINYYFRGNGLDSNGNSISYTPTKERGEVPVEVKGDIESAIIKKYNDAVNSYEQAFGKPTNYFDAYYGFYGKCYVIRVYPFVVVGAGKNFLNLGGVGWLSHELIQVFYYI